jgi:arylformamidase
LQRWEISSPVYPTMPTFPGDPPIVVTATHAIARGDAYNLSSLALGSHTGTHVDPPLHFLAGGAGADRLDLGVLNGRCRVVEVSAEATTISEDLIAALPTEPRRVLFRTANSLRWSARDAFFPDYVALSPAAAASLVERGCWLVGIDALSIERDTTGTFPVHHRLLEGGALILEGLRLADVPAGEYDLHCLPMYLRGGDGAPARAILTSP